MSTLSMVPRKLGVEPFEAIETVVALIVLIVEMKN